MARLSVTRRARAHQRIAQIRTELGHVEYLSSGTLLRRTKVCGKAGCRCAQDPAARHGPYYEWSRRQGPRLAHTVLTPPQARLLAQAIANYRMVRRLLKRWERDSVRLILSEAGEAP